MDWLWSSLGNNNESLEKRQQLFKAKYEKKEQLLEKELEKRERLIQTYLIIFGLFLAYDKEPALQANSMKQFLAFIFFALTYYTCITKYTYYMRSRPEKLFIYAINFSSFFCSLLFSFTLIDYVYAVGTSGVGLPFSKTAAIIMTVMVTWLPLYFSSDLQIQFPETLMLEENRIIIKYYASKTKNFLNFSLYIILILIFSIIAYMILFVVLTTIGGSYNFNLFKCIMLLLAFGLDLVLFSKIISLRTNWYSITFSMLDKRIESFKYDRIIPWKQILKKGFPIVVICTFYIVFFINISSNEIHMIYMQYQPHLFTDQQKMIIYLLYTVISSISHFEILFSLSPHVIDIHSLTRKK